MIDNFYQGPVKEIIVAQLPVVPHSSVPKMFPQYWSTKMYVCHTNPVAKERKWNKYVKEPKDKLLRW